MAKKLAAIVLLTSNVTDSGEFRDSGWEMVVGKDLNEDRARCLIDECRAYDRDNPPAEFAPAPSSESPIEKQN